MRGNDNQKLDGDSGYREMSGMRARWIDENVSVIRDQHGLSTVLHGPECVVAMSELR